MHGHEPTNQEMLHDILSAINVFAENVDGRFNRLETRMDRVEGKVDRLDQRVGFLENRVGSLDDRIGSMETSMATKADLNRFITKEYLDDKLADFKGDLVLLARKQNKKFESLVEELVAEGRLKATAAKAILSLEPFPISVA